MSIALRYDHVQLLLPQCYLHCMNIIVIHQLSNLITWAEGQLLLLVHCRHSILCAASCHAIHMVVKELPLPHNLLLFCLILTGCPLEAWQLHRGHVLS